MTKITQLIKNDLQHVWHPCMQMKDFETCPPIVVDRAEGAYLFTDKGCLIDSISSWWCKSLGHGHPAVLEAIQKQLQRFEHIIGANTTYPNLVELAQLLSNLTGKQHVFFASDGASAVEIALKLTIHANQLKGLPHKNQMIALKNGYHGESLGTMSVSDLGIYKAPYSAFSFPCHFIETIPYLCSTKDPLWSQCDADWEIVETQLNSLKENVCAIILEPIIQGAGGMLVYSAEFLRKIGHWARENNVFLIADEIMTGIGRTGTWLASEHAHISPDLICLSKGLTSGTIPLSCVMIDNSLYELFYSDYSEGKSFLHSNTFSGNPLAIAAALATIKTIEKENLLENAQILSQTLYAHMQEVASLSGKLTNVRSLGAMAAADLENTGAFRIGNQIYQEALELGALIRPIGNTLYWLPPLNTDAEIIGKLAQITLNSINRAYSKANKNEKIHKNIPAYL